MPIIIPGSKAAPTRRRSQVRKRRRREPPMGTKSFEFDGTSDYVSQTNTGIGYFGMNDSNMGPWTVAMWFKTSYDTNYQWLWGIYDSTNGEWSRFLLGIRSSAYTILFQMSGTPFGWDGTMGIGSSGGAPYLGQADGTSSNALCDGNWHHVATTCEGVAGSGKVKVYVDGALVSVGTQGTSVTDPDRTHRVGGYNHNNTLNINGNVAQLALIKSELSAADIAALYNNGNGRTPAAYSPYQWYQFGDNPSDTPTLVVDNGSSGVNFTGYGPPTIVTDAPP